MKAGKKTLELLSRLFVVRQAGHRQVCTVSLALWKGKSIVKLWTSRFGSHVAFMYMWDVLFIWVVPDLCSISHTRCPAQSAQHSRQQRLLLLRKMMGCCTTIILSAFVFQLPFYTASLCRNLFYIAYIVISSSKNLGFQPNRCSVLDKWDKILNLPCLHENCW